MDCESVAREPFADALGCQDDVVQECFLDTHEDLEPVAQECVLDVHEDLGSVAQECFALGGLTDPDTHTSGVLIPSTGDTDMAQQIRKLQAEVTHTKQLYEKLKKRAQRATSALKKTDDKLVEMNKSFSRNLCNIGEIIGGTNTHVGTFNAITCALRRNCGRASLRASSILLTGGKNVPQNHANLGSENSCLCAG